MLAPPVCSSPGSRDTSPVRLCHTTHTHALTSTAHQFARCWLHQKSHPSQSTPLTKRTHPPKTPTPTPIRSLANAGLRFSTTSCRTLSSSHTMPRPMQQQWTRWRLVQPARAATARLTPPQQCQPPTPAVTTTPAAAARKPRTFC